ncbi:MAG: SDR family oxidoreductase [Calditrichaeota bacterium]|nr:MAG: SDR family oxidoreductase [Calditrichota bacterium]
MELNGKIALITGAAGSLGQPVVRELSAAGANVAAVIHISGKADTELFRHPKVIYYPCELTDEHQVQSLFDRVLAEHHRIDFLLHLAGAYAGGVFLEETDYRMWKHMLDINLNTAFLCIKNALRAMTPTGGCIIAVSALSALEISTKRAAYSVSKSALISLCQSAAEEGKRLHIRVNVIAPSIIATAPNRRAMPTADQSKWVKPEEIAALIRFLCSTSAESISGSVIRMP